ncbi:hypothetical protein [Burkholderia sp. RF2-non_BP3]|uniref:hypothetical protein n=1 Tax=Burkholderia sp. RF2-non_BP3 TaxID=1637844 RepID=UPI000B22900B|nr:hypothetical protein [Burkholderia sp. RF2-non_BP3]
MIRFVPRRGHSENVRINRRVMLGGELNGINRMDDQCRKVKAKGRAARFDAGVVTGESLREGEGRCSCGSEKIRRKTLYGILNFDESQSQ